MPEPRTIAGGTRVRPVVHFTAPFGWINDPHAVAYVDGLYHLFYQHNPEATEWSPRCHWGHATSPRLVGWTDHGVALSPDDTDTGVWSGGIAVDSAGATLVYTSIGDGDWADGAISIASGSADWTTWTRDPRNPVVAGPPAGCDTVAFRDPYVWRDADRWNMVVGTGIRGAGGALALYSAPDVASWTFNGLIDVTGARPADAGVFTGDLWECPQLFELDGSWVLMFSAWDDRHVLHDVVYAVGSFDGRRLDVRRWGQFGHGPSPYATTTFVDATGERVAMSWLRERPDVEVDAFAGAHSLPVHLAVVGDRLVATPHRDVLAIRRIVDTRLDEPLESTTMVTAAGLGDDIAAVSVLDGATGEPVVRVSMDVGLDLVVESAGERPIRVPATAGSADVTLVIDADIVEVFAPQIEGMVGLRLPSACRSTAVGVDGPRDTDVVRHAFAPA